MLAHGRVALARPESLRNGQLIGGGQRDGRMEGQREVMRTLKEKEK